MKDFAKQVWVFGALCVVFSCRQSASPCPSPTLNALPSGIALQGYEAAWVENHGVPTTFTLNVPETLSGLRVTSDGVLEGVPTAEGQYTLKVQAKQSCDGSTRTTDLEASWTVMARSCVETPAVAVGEDFFVDVTEASGIQAAFVPGLVAANHNTTHMTEFVDFDNDGFDEIALHNFFSAAKAGLPYRHLFFKNNKDGTFTDISGKTGLSNVVGQAFAKGDLDNDGDVDVVATVPFAQEGAKARVFLNNGDLTFVEVPVSGLESSKSMAVSTVLSDFNNDAKLDLFIAQGYSAQPMMDELFFGKGDGTFENATANLGGQLARQTNSAVACDYDNDGDQDIFVAMYGVSHRNGHNVLWQNRGDGTFVNVAEEKGFAFQKTGNYVLSSTGKGTSEQTTTPYVGNNSFDIVCDDLNNDGYLDIYIAAISHPDSDFNRTWSDPTQVLINQGPASEYAFANEFLQRKLLYNEGDIDVSVVDVNNDGLMDLSAQRDNKYEARYNSEEYKGWLGLMLQLPDGTFENIALTSGINDVSKMIPGKSKGAGSHAFSDFDGDGDMDLIWGGSNYSTAEFPQGRAPVLFRNDFGHRNPWLKLRLVGDGVKVNKSGYGSRASVVWSNFQVTRTLNGSFGHWSIADTQVMHFGMAGRSCGYMLKVQWPDGTVATFDGEALGRNRTYVVTYPDTLALQP